MYLGGENYQGNQNVVYLGGENYQGNQNVVYLGGENYQGNQNNPMNCIMDNPRNGVPNGLLNAKRPITGLFSGAV